MQRFQTIYELVLSSPLEAVAIRAPEASPRRYRELVATVDTTIVELNKMGIGRGDRVAMVLPNGPANAAAFVAIASAATAAPLNPAYKAEELEFFLKDLSARALVTMEGMDSPAAQVARNLGITVLYLTVAPGGQAGRFEFRPDPDTASAGPVVPASPEKSGPARADDIALILHTSGTTSRPKIVPLTHANVCASACNVRDALKLQPSDCGLSIMPLFHIHGLIASLLAPLAAGSSVYCTPGFNALKFFAWMQEAKPTWYTAVPTMHQTILSRASKNLDVIRANPLRFIRSSSSSIPPQVIRSIEETFDAPLIEAYGMTEAAHQMACNPLPPGERKPGTVGKAAGPELAILGSDGSIKTSDATGEIVIRGANVTSGYENNPKANTEAYVEGWFRTGDLGVIDDCGYVSITGRIKEIINRGGEKISPREIDEILLDHPAIEQVITFAIPHPRLGEDVGAVVVLREGQEADERSLRAFVSNRAAEFKVPSRIIFVDEIPKGATGKPQRIGLAEKLGLVASP